MICIKLRDQQSILPCKKEELQCGDGRCHFNWLPCHYKKDCGTGYMSIQITCSTRVSMGLGKIDCVMGRLRGSTRIWEIWAVIPALKEPNFLQGFEEPEKIWGQLAVLAVQWPKHWLIKRLQTGHSRECRTGVSERRKRKGNDGEDFVLLAYCKAVSS
uniref:Uncharacterized protein n=1 Tax=Sphaerodactylus townsendi TaxID=933632 RepID=A0ACB8EA37_9SAUR